MICFGVDPVAHVIAAVDDDFVIGRQKFSETITHWIVEQLSGHDNAHAIIMRPVPDTGSTLSDAVIHRIGMWQGVLMASGVDVHVVTQIEMPEMATPDIIAVQCQRRAKESLGK